jgi:hypothetical protein
MRLSSSGTTATDRVHPHTISLKLRDTNQLFNSMDPSPFIEKDLDDDAEEFIVSWAQEFTPNAPIKLRIHLDQWPDEDPKEMIRTAVHNHFAHRAQITELEFKRLLRQGRISLFIGLLFLAACLFRSKMLLAELSQLRRLFAFFARICMVKPFIFRVALGRNGRVETKCLPFDTRVLALCSRHVSAQQQSQKRRQGSSLLQHRGEPSHRC